VRRKISIGIKKEELSRYRRSYDVRGNGLGCGLGKVRLGMAGSMEEGVCELGRGGK